MRRHRKRTKCAPSTSAQNAACTVPASEVWLCKNPEALASVKQGLRESAEGKSIDRGSFAKFTRE
jgi:hypothetical protein